MEEEEEICRVCRSGGTEDQPLFYPCKCSGSIRYVHQDCLLEWLKHSRKERCELCEHPFTFTPVYRQDMPEVLPAVLYLQQLRKKVGFVISNALRATLVFNVWLTILPYFTVWIWRLYFYMGHSLSRQLADLYQLRVGQNVTDTKSNESFFQEYKSRLNLQ
ncbi:Putative ER-localized ubiquitin ligase Doa10 [Rhizopus microsporus]|nr:Putative ER-localized ubiquitin ligase Doa10 [Rhizopus microsporus]